MTDFVDNLNPAITQFLQLVQNKPVDWESKPAPGKWSNKEIIGHLCDSAMINLQRFIRCTYEEGFKLIYEQDEWVMIQHYQDMNINDLLELWRLLNLQIARVLGNYPADRWQARCDNSKAGTALHTVEWLAKDYADHLQHHLSQIRYEPRLSNVPASAAGYSGTPLAKKLGIKEGFYIDLINAPDYYLQLFTDLPPDLYFDTGEDVKTDLVHFFTKSKAEYEALLPAIKEKIKPNGMIWVSWPKRSAKINTDITEDIIRDYALKSGLVDVKVCAVDDTWSGLKLVIPVKNRV